MSMYESVEQLHGLDFIEDDENKNRTKQSMKDECDINNIMMRYTKTGMITHLARGVPQFADVSKLTSYKEAIDNIHAATEYFYTLPAKVRSKFENDPASFIEITTSPDAKEKLTELGILALENKESKKEAPIPSPEPVPDPDPKGPE